MSHLSVLLGESIEGLAIKPDGIYFDGTTGLGGHSFEIAKQLTTGRLIACDRDEFALGMAGERLREYKERVTFVHGNFGDIAELIGSLGIDKVDGVLCDFGVSSPQLDRAERGFSYMQSAPLDMRMNAKDTLTAFDIVNSWSEEELRRILFEYGEERYARRIVERIIESRPVNTTDELVEIIKSSMPTKALREKQHPAKRSFQGIRLAVNDELGEIKRLLATVTEVLNTGGRVALISFHSLEDRLVKNSFRAYEDGCTCSRDFPKCVCGFEQKLKVLTKKPVIPNASEIEANPRARSAKLRIAERV